MAGILGFTVLVVFMFLKIHYESYTDEKKLKYEMRLRELVEDKKRKGSDRASILGENVDSRHASLASRRFSMPVPDLSGSDAFMQPFDMGGIEDFKTYDPEKDEYPGKPGKVDKEYLTKLGIINAGFAKDEVDNVSRDKKSNKIQTTAVIENLELSKISDTRFGKPLEKFPDEVSLSTASVADSGVNSYTWDSDFKDSPAPKSKKMGGVRFASFEETFGGDADDSSESSNFQGRSRLQQRRGTQFVIPSYNHDEDDASHTKTKSILDVNDLIKTESKSHDIEDIISADNKESLTPKEGEVRFASFAKSYEGDDDSSEDSDHEERRNKLQQRRGTQFVSSFETADYIADRDNSSDEPREIDTNDNSEIFNKSVQDEQQNKVTGLTNESTSTLNEQGATAFKMNSDASHNNGDNFTQEQIELHDFLTKPKAQSSLESLEESKIPVGEFLSTISEVDDSDADNWSRGYVSVDGDNMSERSFLSTTGDNTV